MPARSPGDRALGNLVMHGAVKERFLPGAAWYALALRTYLSSASARAGILAGQPGVSTLFFWLISLNWVKHAFFFLVRVSDLGFDADRPELASAPALPAMAASMSLAPARRCGSDAASNRERAAWRATARRAASAGRGGGGRATQFCAAPRFFWPRPHGNSPMPRPTTTTARDSSGAAEDRLTRGGGLARPAMPPCARLGRWRTRGHPPSQPGHSPHRARDRPRARPASPARTLWGEW